MSYLFSFSDIKQNRFYFRPSSKLMADRKKMGRGNGKTELQKFGYLENEKNFLDEIKSFFHNYLRTLFDEKN